MAVLPAIPANNGTYGDIARQAAERGASLSLHTRSRWVNKGRADTRAREISTGYAGFAQRFDEIKTEYCGHDANRNYELNRAFEILEQAGECDADRPAATTTLPTKVANLVATNPAHQRLRFS